MVSTLSVTGKRKEYMRSPRGLSVISHHFRGENQILGDCLMRLSVEWL